MTEDLSIHLKDVILGIFNLIAKLIHIGQCWIVILQLKIPKNAKHSIFRRLILSICIK